MKRRAVAHQDGGRRRGDIERARRGRHAPIGDRHRDDERSIWRLRVSAVEIKIVKITALTAIDLQQCCIRTMGAISMLMPLRQYRSGRHQTRLQGHIQPHDDEHRDGGNHRATALAKSCGSPTHPPEPTPKSMICPRPGSRICPARPGCLTVECRHETPSGYFLSVVVRCRL